MSRLPLTVDPLQTCLLGGGAGTVDFPCLDVKTFLLWRGINSWRDPGIYNENTTLIICRRWWIFSRFLKIFTNGAALFWFTLGSVLTPTQGDFTGGIPLENELCLQLTPGFIELFSSDWGWVTRDAVKHQFNQKSLLMMECNKCTGMLNTCQLAAPTDGGRNWPMIK